MVRGKKDMSKESIMNSIKILCNTVECKKPFKMFVIDKLLATLLYTIIVAGIVITIITII
jgi:hypothetical protein